MTYMTLSSPVPKPFKFYNSMFSPFYTRPVRHVNNWQPHTDISETEDGFEVRTELPGVSKDDVKISVKDNFLTIQGEKRWENGDESKNYRRIERRFGNFERRFSLPPKVDVDSITADYTDGVLTLSIPKPDEVKPKEIPIGTESVESVE